MKVKGKMKDLKRNIDKIVCAVMVCAVSSVSDDIQVSAATANADAVLTPLNNLKTLLTSVVAAIGVIVIIKNVMEIASALQNQDSAGVASGLKGFAGGVLMAAIGTVLTILGVK